MTENQVDDVENVEDYEDTETTPFVDEENREIAYRADSAGHQEAAATQREAIIGEGVGLGRRKRATARVRLSPGTGQWSINGHTLEEFFPNKLHQQLVKDPFTVAGVLGAYDVAVRVEGGGITGQAGAVQLGIARALNSIDREGSRPALKKAGLLSRDARVKERKKAGLKKARKASQYSKR